MNLLKKLDQCKDSEIPYKRVQRATNTNVHIVVGAK